MRSEHIQSGQHHTAGTSTRSWLPGDKVFVRREFDFWHPATVYSLSSLGVTVQFDDMEELTVASEDLLPLQLEPEDMVFLQPQTGFLGGTLGWITSVQGQVVDVEIFDLVYDRTPLETPYLIRDIRIYATPVVAPWKEGEMVAAYWPVYVEGRSLPLFFPGLVQDIHHHVSVEIDFVDGDYGLVPTTLVQPLELNSGDQVYARDDYSTDASSFRRFHVVKYQGETAILQDESGRNNRVHLAQLAVLPKGYRIIGDKLEKS